MKQNLIRVGNSALNFIYISSHELNDIGGTTCFMSLGQSSGNWTEIWSVFSCCEKSKQIEPSRQL